MRRAFTLIELMATIAIMSILLGLASAGLSSARAGARRIACLSHLRSLGVAMTSYMDRASALPLAGYMPDVRRGHNELAVALESFLEARTPSVDAAGSIISAPPYRCPADAGAWALSGQSYDYRFALWLTPAEWWHEPTRIPDGRYMKRAMAELREYPAHMVLMSDHGEWHGAGGGGRASQANQARRAESNSLYADGHADWSGYGRSVWARPGR